jgi:geranyl-CoA carboxylase alpha subunit
MVRALSDTAALGLTTNKRFLTQLLTHPLFLRGEVNTHFIHDHFPDAVRKQVETSGADEAAVAVLVGLHDLPQFCIF